MVDRAAFQALRCRRQGGQGGAGRHCRRLNNRAGGLARCCRAREQAHRHRRCRQLSRVLLGREVGAGSGPSQRYGGQVVGAGSQLLAVVAPQEDLQGQGGQQVRGQANE